MNRVSITAEQIETWRHAPSEHRGLEFKEAKQQYDARKLRQYCVAIANEGGGFLVFGISDKPPRKVVGTKAFQDLIGRADQLYEALGFRVDIEEVNHPQGRILVFQIPSRPQGTAYHVDGAYLMRSGESLVPMSEDRLRQIFAEGKPEWLEEHVRTGMSPQQVVDMLDTQSFFELVKFPYPRERTGVLDRLEREHLIDRIDGSYSIRRIGALLLAKRLDEFPGLGRKAPRVVIYAETSKLETRLDQVGAKGYAVGFRSLVRYIKAHLPGNEVIKDALRTDVQLIPEVAIRELVANALIHQDLSMRGASVMVEVYSNRLEISNPGEPVVPVERFIDGYESRNERLAAMMRRFGICEEKSSGIDRVVQTAEMCQLPAPDFRTDHRRTRVILSGPKRFEDMDRDDRVRACYQHCPLKWVMSQAMTNHSLRKRFSLPENKSAVVSQVIAATIDAKLVKADDTVGASRKFARYLPFWA